MKYQRVTEGEWVQPVRRHYKLACCDCGLVHRVNFRLRDNRIQFQAFRAPRATGQVRRWKDDMPAKSKAQQRLIAAAEHGATFPKAKAMAKSMTHDQMHDFAVGPMKGKPTHVKKR